jgi:exopolysaccharide production protein ExoY
LELKKRAIAKPGRGICHLYEGRVLEIKFLSAPVIFACYEMNFPFHKAQSLKMVYPVLIPRWKRSLDIVFVLLILPLVLPLAVLVAGLVRVVSKGPVLFRQERVGYLGRKFMCYKFRTMFVGAETKTHQGHLQNLMKSEMPMVKLDARGDSRIIPFGMWLRSSGLDELPQLINVLRGEMSMVGPRPCLAYECDNYLPWQWERFNTLPGLTGLWQVNGKNQTTFAEMMRLDINYSREKSFWLDLKIIFKTPLAIAVQVWYSRKRKKSLALGAQTPRSYQTNL